MQKLLWIGSPFFAPELADCGWENVRVHNFETPDIYCWDDLVALAGFTPDVLVVADKSRPPFVLGMEEFPCLTVFYSVDSHIHSWQPMYAQGFDACLVSLKDNIPLFTGPFLPANHVWWSPPFAKESDQPQEGVNHEWDCLFVGSNNKEVMPRRALFLENLGKKLPSLQIMGGNYQTLYPRAKVLINHAEHGDMNFRIFEAMGCGKCLVTPRIGHGLPNMFVDGEHLVFYAPEDAGDASYRINFLLDHPEIIDHIGKTAYEAINAGHRAKHRAQALTDHLCDLFMEGAEDIVASRRAKAALIREKCLTLPYLLWAGEVSQPVIKDAYLEAAKGRCFPRLG